MPASARYYTHLVEAVPMISCGTLAGEGLHSAAAGFVAPIGVVLSVFLSQGDLLETGLLLAATGAGI
jgi:hypothetical protein